jgi:hypothetical protein
MDTTDTRTLPLNVRLPVDQMEWLNARAAGTRLTRSDIIRLIIDDAMDKDQEGAVA